MTEKQLIKLNFEKQQGEGFHYYTYDLGRFCLISSDSDMAKSNKWKVYMFDAYNDFKFDDYKDVKELIGLLNKAYKNECADI